MQTQSSNVLGQIRQAYRGLSERVEADAKHIRADAWDWFRRVEIPQLAKAAMRAGADLDGALTNASKALDTSIQKQVAALRANAFDKTASLAAQLLQTQDLAKIRAALRRSGVIGDYLSKVQH